MKKILSKIEKFCFIIFVLVVVLIFSLSLFFGLRGVNEKEKIEESKVTFLPQEISEEISTPEDVNAIEEEKEEGEKFQIPSQEVLIHKIAGDTNNDGKIETLIVTENRFSKRGHFYILSDSGEKLYEMADILTLPDNLELRVFKNDKYPSYFLIFEGQFKEGYFICWDGESYSVPEDL
ncbi:MAG: hypothetical protein COX43_03500 [Parcubacteria group bacterium CG23_combo_of_CG06-09_8_20_14_all_35_9]|nr:MAG: hypothetical protein COX43_03500 [Parcubacteria group bacterium CG23_combo_of_CG06-09_8_20_14_all_35_9]